jgi:NAD(P)-dependent dehydrogenase (short-subunit alcohol dehydrogenase family)
MPLHFHGKEVGNAGGSTRADGLVTTASLDEFWEKMRVDRFGTFLTLRFAIPEMVKSGGGSVVNMVSIAGFGNLTHGRSAYASSKAAVMNLTRSTAHVFAKDRVRVNAIAPAGVGTARIRKNEGNAYQVLEYLDGETLAARLKTRNVLDASDVLRIVRGWLAPSTTRIRAALSIATSNLST